MRCRTYLDQLAARPDPQTVAHAVQLIAMTVLQTELGMGPHYSRNTQAFAAVIARAACGILGYSGQTASPRAEAAGATGQRHVFSIMSVRVRHEQREDAIAAFRARRVLEECAEAIPGFIKGYILADRDAGDRLAVIAEWRDPQSFRDWMAHPVARRRNATWRISRSGPRHHPARPAQLRRAPRPDGRRRCGAIGTGGDGEGRSAAGRRDMTGSGAATSCLVQIAC